MKTLKNYGRFTVLGVAAVLFLYCLSTSISAAQVPDNASSEESGEYGYEVYTRDESDAQSEEAGSGFFDDVKPTDNIVPLSDGGFLIGSGQVEIYSLDDLENPIDVIDLDNNENAISKETANELVNGNLDSDESVTLQDVAVSN